MSNNQIVSGGIVFENSFIGNTMIREIIDSLIWGVFGIRLFSALGAGWQEPTGTWLFHKLQCPSVLRLG
jgi:hypothetical protein